MFGYDAFLVFWNADGLPMILGTEAIRINCGRKIYRPGTWDETLFGNDYKIGFLSTISNVFRIFFF